MKTDEHPADLPTFNKMSPEAVWYLSHPLAPDDRYTFEQNMAHVLHMMRLCFEEGFRVVTPYHTHCLVLDDTNMQHRKMGLEIDCQIARMLGLMILTGHKISKGMQTELGALKQGPSNFWIDLTGLSDAEARAFLKVNHKRLKQVHRITPLDTDAVKWRAEHMGTWPPAKSET